MDRHNLNLALFSLHLLLFTFLTCNLTASSTKLATSNPLEGVVCSLPLINCGQGTCKASNASLLGFECECHPGWKAIQIGPLVFPSCVIPNCTINFNCDSGSIPPPPPPSPIVLPPPPVNFSNPCNFIWCGDGTCVANGTGHICQCNKGSANLFNMTGLACFQQCSFGADCQGLGFGAPPPPLQPPPPSSSGSPGNGSTEVSNSSRSLRALTMTFLAVTFLTWL